VSEELRSYERFHVQYNAVDEVIAVPGRRFVFRWDPQVRVQMGPAHAGGGTHPGRSPTFHVTEVDVNVLHPRPQALERASLTVNTRAALAHHLDAGTSREETVTGTR
jgi:hypothetical protein